MKFFFSGKKSERRRKSTFKLIYSSKDMNIKLAKRRNVIQTINIPYYSNISGKICISRKAETELRRNLIIPFEPVSY